MSRRLLWSLLKFSGLAGPIILFQQGCAIDPDLALRAGLQVFSETLIFALDNVAVNLR